jgi:hypothetical protein
MALAQRVGTVLRILANSLGLPGTPPGTGTPTRTVGQQLVIWQSSLTGAVIGHNVSKIRINEEKKNLDITTSSFGGEIEETKET